jgi:hypothetical protein
MGCEFWLYGRVPDPSVQEAFIRFVIESMQRPFRPIIPRPSILGPTIVFPKRRDPKLEYKGFDVGRLVADLFFRPDTLLGTEIRPDVSANPHDDPELGEMMDKYFEMKHRPNMINRHPYDYYGIDSDGRQFVFDRCDGGRLVSLDGPQVNHMDGSELSPSALETFDVPIKVHHEITHGERNVFYPLLLNILRLRFCPRLRVEDDFGEFKVVRFEIRRRNLERCFTDEDVSFEECCNILQRQPGIHDRLFRLPRKA